MEEIKNCTKCGTCKPLNEFVVDNKIKSGYAAHCKECAKVYSRGNKELPKVEITSKICSKCKIERNAEEFSKNSYKPDGLRSACKHCDKIYINESADRLAEYNKNNSEKQKERKRLYRQNNKEYFKERDKKYAQDNKEAIKAYKKQYRKNNPEIIKKWIVENKEKINETARIYLNNKRKTDTLFKLKGDIRGLILQSFKTTCDGEYRKGSKTVDILGCTVEEFKNHIESQFLPWMNWGNHGKCEINEYDCSWNLDHIIPISLARNEEEIYMLNHWSNFQPLCSRINQVDKSNTHYFVCNLELGIDSFEYFTD